MVPVFRIDGTYFLDTQKQQRAFLSGRAVKLTPERAAAIFKRSVRVARWEIVSQAAGAAPAHASWKKNSLLQGCVPLVFEHGVAVSFDGLIVRLDPELGLVYAKPDSAQS